MPRFDVLGLLQSLSGHTESSLSNPYYFSHSHWNVTGWRCIVASLVILDRYLGIFQYAKLRYRNRYENQCIHNINILTALSCFLILVIFYCSRVIRLGRIMMLIFLPFRFLSTMVLQQHGKTFFSRILNPKLGEKAIRYLKICCYHFCAFLTLCITCWQETAEAIGNTYWTDSDISPWRSTAQKPWRKHGTDSSQIQTSEKICLHFCSVVLISYPPFND